MSGPGGREELRRVYQGAWAKRRRGEPLDAMESLVADVIGEHPEYHSLMDDPDALHADYPPEAGQANPFLHLGMHVALREQIAGDRPPGIAALVEALARGEPDRHALEHRLLDCLGETLWRAQRDGRLPDEAAYLECVRGLARRGRGR